MKIWFRVNALRPPSSWTFVWHYLGRALASQGYEVARDPFVLPREWNEKDVVELWWGDPATWSWSEHGVGLKAGIALSEARSIQAAGRDVTIRNINESDLLICPSQHAAAAYREAPIHVPISVSFFGVDVQEFRPVNRDWNGLFRFLHLGNTQYRKGSWMVPEAFRKAFPKEEDVVLTIACFVESSAMFHSLRQEYGRDSRMSFICEMLPSSNELYATHHALLSSHLAEGFGLCIAEAMATGMACLVSRCSAPLEFFSDECGWWIEMSELYAPVAWCLKDTGGYWRLPDVDDMALKMREMYESREECRKRGDWAAGYVAGALTWKHCAQRIAAVLKNAGGW